MRNSRPKRRQLVTIDCETDPFLYGRMPKPFVWGVYDGETFTVFDNAGEMVSKLANRYAVVYAHNGGRFDFHYLAKYVPLGTELLIVNGRLVSFKIGSCEFRDSYSLIPIPLAAYEKTKIDYTKLEAGVRDKHRTEIINYLRDDCINLYNLIEEFQSRYGRTSKTLASAAMGEFRKIHGRVGKTSPAYFRTFRDYYHGGRTQDKRRGIIREQFTIFDINSAYPYAMTFEHPYGSDFIADRTQQGFDNCGFYTIDADSRGALPIFIDGKLEFPEARATFKATGWEINAGIETRTLTVHRVLEAYTFKARITFTEYIDKFYAQKQKSEKGSPAYIFSKLMLNSLYGKFGANPTNYWHFKTATKADITRLEPDGWKFSGYFGNNVLIAKRLTEDEGRFYNIATAASITGFVRAYLWKAINRCGTYYYCDTDSIVTNSTSGVEVGKALGQFSIDGRGDYGAIAGRKLYALRLEDGKWKVSSKGCRLTAQQIVAIAKGNRVQYRQDAPTFSMFGEPRFLLRNVGMVD